MKIRITIEGARASGKTYAMNMLEAALRQHYRYVHWLQVSDFPENADSPPTETREMEVKL